MPETLSKPKVAAPWLSPRGVGEPARPVIGTMNFGGRIDDAEAERIVRRALERGAVHFDTANAYSKGEAERVLGRALGSDARRAFITTKVGFGRREGKSEGLSKSSIVRAAAESRERMKVDVIDLYLLHVPDYTTQTRETLEAIKTLLDEGVVRAYGVSKCGLRAKTDTCQTSVQ